MIQVKLCSEKMRKDLPFLQCCQKGVFQASSRQGAAIIHNLGVELIHGNNVLKMLYILNRPVAVLQFWVKNYEMRDNSQLLENQSQVCKNLLTVS